MSLNKEFKTREIITKAVCGKGQKFSQATHTVLPPNSPSSILGAWVINHSFEAHNAGDVIEVVGTYDINVWYSYAKNTKTDVAKETVSYVEQVPLSYLDANTRADTLEVSAKATQEPNCIDAKVSSSGDGVLIHVEREFAVECVGETKVCVVCIENDDIKEFDFDGADDGDFEDLDPDLFIDDLDD
jgi:spore coat protein E